MIFAHSGGDLDDGHVRKFKAALSGVGGGGSFVHTVGGGGSGGGKKRKKGDGADEPSLDPAEAGEGRHTFKKINNTKEQKNKRRLHPGLDSTRLSATSGIEWTNKPQRVQCILV